MLLQFKTKKKNISLSNLNKREKNQSVYDGMKARKQVKRVRTNDHKIKHFKIYINESISMVLPMHSIWLNLK